MDYGCIRQYIIYNGDNIYYGAAKERENEQKISQGTQHEGIVRYAYEQ